MIWKWAVFAAMVLYQASAENSYIVTMPTVIRPGLDLKILVNILTAQGDVTVTTSLWRSQGPVIFPQQPPILQRPPIGVAVPFGQPPAVGLVQQPSPIKPPAPANPQTEEKVLEQQTVVSAGNPVTVSMTLPDNLIQGNYYLLVSGSGGLTFEKRGELRLFRNSLAVFIQTDKGIYRPGQTVLFRVFAVKPDLKPYTGTLDIDVFDANNNRIKQYANVQGDANIFSNQFTLSDQPVMGSWRIEARALSHSETVRIRVEQFVLPKFEVTVDVPSFGHTEDTDLSGAVEAKYTFGKTVDGSVLLRIRKTNILFSPRGTPCQEPIIEKRFQLNGRTSFIISATELQFLNQGCDGLPVVNNPSAATLNFLRGTVLKVEADVTESLTGNTLSGSDTIEFSEAKYRLQWLGSNSENYKPGLWYDAYVKVTKMDGSPVPVTQTPQFVTLTVVAEFEDGCGAFNPVPAGSPPKIVKAPTRLTPLKATLPNNGLIYWSDIVPVGSVAVTFTASFPEAFNATHRVDKMDSPSNNYIQVFLFIAPVVKVGENAEFEILSTMPMGKLIYQVIARGNVVRTVVLDGQGRTGFFESVPVTNQMAPAAKFVIYTVLASGEVLADSVSFNVDGIYDNEVSIGLSHSRAEPGQDISVTVTSDANSVVNLMAVDQSILLLDKGNDITPDRVESKISAFGGGSAIPFDALRFPAPFSGGDVTSIFRNADVTIITDTTLHIKSDCRVRLFGRIAKTVVQPAASQLPTASAPGEGLVDPARVRTLFPDTWLWVNKTTGSDGQAVFSATVPDTITSWVTSAFAMNPVTGLGVAPINPKLEAFLPFFVSLNLPKSVIRGEEVILQAIVFNFLQVDTLVTVTLSRSNQFLNIDIDANGQTFTTSEDKSERIQVNAGEAKSVFFPIIPSVLGNIDLSVSARSAVAADALIRQLRVEPEGVAQEYNRPLLIDLTASGARFSQSLPIPLPSNVVPGSVRVKANVLGDILGPTINNLDKLLKMPSGCGEQNMINFAPDVFIMKYLNATSQLNNEIRDKATRFLELGYQRELSYQRFDGSFSAFGNSDAAGSMWLTAFVAKSFCEAKPFTFIDDNVVNRAIDWIVANQAPSGAFPETGNVIHTEMQGGAASGTALTAYVVVAISEKEDLTSDPQKMAARASAISRARSFLEASTGSLRDVYALSIVAYALKRADSRVADRVFARLQTLATVQNGEKFWPVPTDASSNPVPAPGAAEGIIWTPPIIVRSLDVEATAYALLTIAQGDNTTEGLPVIKWLAQQRNPNGGFASTQDTVVALEALCDFASLIYRPNANVNVDVNARGFNQAFSISRSSSLVLQSADIPGPPDNVTVSATGSGTAVVEVSVAFNVFGDIQPPSFDVNLNLRNETLNGFVIESCASYTRNSKSGMVVEEIGVPTGFQADVDSIGKVPGLKRTESLDRKVVLYFDQITSLPVCVSMKVDRVGLVAKTQAVPVRVFQYYKPDEQVTEFYQSQLLKDSSFCDVCLDCKCPPKTPIV